MSFSTATGDVIELVDSSSDEGEANHGTLKNSRGKEMKTSVSAAASRRPDTTILNPYRKKPVQAKRPPSPATKPNGARSARKVTKEQPKNNSLQDAFVLEEDLGGVNYSAASSESFGGGDDDEDHLREPWEAFLEQQNMRRRRGERLQLFEDEDFACLPNSIRGSKSKASATNAPTCRCRGSKTPAKLAFNKKDRPYYSCADRKCNFFQYAMQAEQMHWYRFGAHTGHCLVTLQGFRAQDLLQGKVGDCWFLSALAVVAERPDLIKRLFMTNSPREEDGIVQVRLFLDGYWKVVTMDNFLPCLVDDESEEVLQLALKASLGGAGESVLGRSHSNKSNSSSSLYDSSAVSNKCKDVLKETAEYLDHQFTRLTGRVRQKSRYRPLERTVTSDDLAYSKAKLNQLWVPFLEKAYAKSHGSYQAISGGHIAEAFLDLTGAPTRVFDLHARGFKPRAFWYQLLQFRKQRLPMGCGTSSSAVGIIGMHAYSILDLREIKNVDYKFFQETGVAHGNVSGFTEYDGTVRLLRIRNPHGKGEWQGEFSDRSVIWEKLVQHCGNLDIVERTMKNDGTFWIDYDNFLLGFSNVDVVLAFLGNHGRSFASNFPAKNSNHRCARAFEVSLVEDQPGVPSRDTVEIYVMGIQKTRRGARSGRADRKVSYKVSDLGMLVGEGYTRDENGEVRFSSVKGQMFGFNRNGHKRLVLDRESAKTLVVMPVSFGHPAATDKELPFVLRFVSDAPLIIRELAEVPRMDRAIQQFCLSPKSPFTNQGIHKVLLQDRLCRVFQVDCRSSGGGTVFLYSCINETELQKEGLVEEGLSFSVEATCRGMSCRTEQGLLEHKTLAKGKKFEAAWRQFTADFVGERQSRLVLVLYQSGQDTEFGSITVRRVSKLGRKKEPNACLDSFLGIESRDEYNNRGIFNPPKEGNCYNLTSNLEYIDSSAGYHGSQEELLDRALAMSRGELELQQALELSLLEGGEHEHTSLKDRDAFDTDLQKALELSKIESISCSASAKKDEAFVSGASQSNLDSSYDDDLSKAIQLSMMESQSKPAARSDPIMVDLTDEPSSRTENGKRQRTDTMVADNKPSIDEDRKPVDMAEKRRLAAEAAMKRFKRR